MNKTVIRVWITASVLFAAACGIKPDQYYQAMRPNLLTGNYQAASEYLEKNRTKIFSERDRLLYFMDQGMVTHMAKKYKESNKLLESAKQTAEDLWTESISANAAAWVTTDNSLPYQGEDFEKVLIHFVAALNYIGLGDHGAARVEARQITNKLELYNSKYTEGKNAYRDDGFARWLSGRLAETEGGRTALNDAWIDYKKAIEIYQTDYAERYHVGVPRFVVADALRVLEALGGDFKEEYNEIKARFPAVTYTKEADLKEMGQVVFIHLSGEAPAKIDKYWEARSDQDILRIAYPEFVAKPMNIVGAAIEIGGPAAQTEVAEPLTAIAVQNLADHMGRIQAKAIARAVAKFVAAKAAQAGGEKMAKSSNKNMALAGSLLSLAGTAAEIGNYAAEQADKRSWITLPAAVNVAQVVAPAGQQELKVTLLNAGGRPARTVTLPVDVKAGQISFVYYRTFE